MTQLTEEGHRIVTDQAARHGVSHDTVLHLLTALHRGGGTQAQFNIGELGGMGQWLQGGMVMVGDMFNTQLKGRVDALCSDLAATLRGHTVFAPEPSQPEPSQSTIGLSAMGWPSDLGHPSAQGAQNDMRYALFPATNRLAVLQNGQTTVYDTSGHSISGFGQAQGGGQSLCFSSQHGTYPLSTLPVMGDAPPQPAAPTPAPSTDDQIFTRIERLAALRDSGALTEAEFIAKKTDLLARL